MPIIRPSFISIFVLGDCGKSEQSLRMIAGGNGQAIGKVSTEKLPICSLT